VSEQPHRGAAAPVVTMAGLYGTGISVIGPRVAQELDVPFLDRGILAGVAEHLHVPVASVETLDSDDEKTPRGLLSRFFTGLSRTPMAGPAVDVEENRYRAATEEFLARATIHGGVVVGRAGAVVLRDIPGVLNVRLDGPREARILQAMRIFGFDRETAEARQEANDRARINYVRRQYGVDPDDPDLYDLRMNSTAIDWDTCVELIVTAARSGNRRPATADG
jgi:cytidylate kinase